MKWWNGFALLLTGVFGVLTLLAMQATPSTGILLRLMEPDPHPCLLPDCYGRVVVLQISTKGYKVNQDEVPRDRLPSIISEIMKTRAEKEMYFMAQPDVSYEEVVEPLTEIQTAVPDLQIVVITDTDLQSGVLRRVRPTRAERIKWGEIEFSGVHAPWEEGGPLNIR